MQRLTEVYTDDVREIAYTYNADGKIGNVTSVTDELAHITHFMYALFYSFQV